MISKFATVVFFGVFCLAFFVNFAYAGLIEAVAAGVIAVSLLMGA